MNKRQRKKFGVGEFARQCFLFSADYEGEKDETLWSSFVAKIEELDLLCTGMWDDGQIELCFDAGLVNTGEQNRREAFSAWIGLQPDYKNVQVGELFDSTRGYLED